MTHISEGQRARFIYAKIQKKCEIFYIYTKSQTLFNKQDNLQYVFIYIKQDIYVTRFS